MKTTTRYLVGAAVAWVVLGLVVSPIAIVPVLVERKAKQLARAAGG